MTRQWDYLVLKVMPSTLPSEPRKSNMCCKSITDAESKRISCTYMIHSLLSAKYQLSFVVGTKNQQQAEHQTIVILA
jgi:hypothetical protein